MSNILEIKNLKAEIEGKEILKGVDLEIPAGEIHAIMGPNGSGKSTLSNVIMGHPSYKVTEGSIRFKGQEILEMPTDERARLGIFLGFQYPHAIPGVSVTNFLRNVLKNNRGGKDVPIREFRTELTDAMNSLEMDSSFAKRYVNDGFSGGEKKRHEILQMNLLKPGLAILDEIDSGLDIDALRIIAQNIEKQKSADRSMLIITHYKRILDYLSLDKVHVFAQGKILTSGAADLAEKLEAEGYDWIIKEQVQA